MYSDSLSSEILAAITDTSLQEADLHNCDREPIHIPNLIQPHGVLIAVDAAEYQILQVSLNTSKMLGIEPQKLLNKPLASLLGDAQTKAIKQCLVEDFDNINPIPIELVQNQSAIYFQGIVHRNQETIILELEPNLPGSKS